MAELRQRLACLLCAVTATLAWPAFASEQGFPFARELMLDVAPMRGSKRVPIIEIAENGAAVIQLWCASTRGQANIDQDSITIVADQVPPTQCDPERQTRDDSLLAALTQVTNWRRQGEVVEFQGATKLRFRLMTN
jgi:META domain-containing protein